MTQKLALMKIIYKFTSAKRDKKHPFSQTGT